MARLGRSQPFKPKVNYQGRTGIYFNVAYISGTVTLSGAPVSGATIRLVRQDTGEYVATTTTNGSGVYSFTGITNLSPLYKYHTMVEYTNGGDKYNAKSLWDITPLVTT